MAERKPLGHYLNLWKDFLNTQGNPRVELLHMEDFITFIRAAVKVLMDNGQLEDVYDLSGPQAQQLIAGIGLFLNQTGGYERWKTLEKRMREELARLETELETAQARIDELDSSNSNREHLAQELRDQYADVQTSFEERERVFKAREEAVGSLQAQLAEARVLVEKKDATIEDMIERLAAKEQELQDFQAEMDRLKLQLAELRRRTSFAEAEMRKAQEIMEGRIGATYDDQVSVSKSTLEGITAERAAQKLYEEWGFPASLPEELNLSGLLETEDMLNFRFGTPSGRQELQRDVSETRREVEGLQARYLELRNRPKHKPLTPKEFNELIRLEARLTAWTLCGMLLARTVRTGQQQPQV